MGSEFTDLKSLVADDRLDEALERLSSARIPRDLINEAVVLRNALRHSQKQLRRGVIADEQDARTRSRIASAILGLVADAERDVVSSGQPRSVFISYSHTEQFLVLRLRDLLRARGLVVIVDVDELQPGERIDAFIRRSVQKARHTVVVASTASLSSPWVVLEVVTTLQAEDPEGTGRLLACYTEPALFQPEFRLRITETIDQQVGKIDGLISEYVVKSLDFTDLTDQRDRLLRMRLELGKILERLRGTLALGLDADTILDVAARLATHVQHGAN